jgi:uncharacterized protein YegJ (DUF2314 family)
MGGFGCWVIALVLLGVVGAVALYILKVGAVLAVKRDREQHLRILNEARRRVGKPPLTEADLPPEPPPERDELLERIFDFFRGKQRGFEVRTGETARPSAKPAQSHRAVLPVDDTDEEMEARRPTPQRVLPISADEAAGDAGAESGKPRHSIVLLESSFRPMTEEKLRACVQKAWGVELSTDRSTTEWVVYAKDGGPGLISCGGVMLMFQNFAGPYFQDAEAAAAETREMRMQDAIRRSRAHRTVVVMGAPPEVEREGIYALLCKLAVEIAGNTTLGVCLPEEGLFLPYGQGVLRAMLSENPLEALGHAEIEWVPIMDENDKELLDAIQIAKARFGEFEEAFASRAITGSGKKSPFLVKAEFSDGVNSEHMWVEVTAIEPGRVRGYLRSSPVNLPNLVQDEEVSVRKTDISDWIGTLNGESIGNFTGPVIEKRHRRRQD